MNLNQDLKRKKKNHAHLLKTSQNPNKKVNYTYVHMSICSKYQKNHNQSNDMMKHNMPIYSKPDKTLIADMKWHTPMNQNHQKSPNTTRPLTQNP